MNKSLKLGGLCEKTVSSALKLCPQILMLLIVFDSYLELSLKECERNRRTNVHPIDIIGMTPATLIPQQLDKFWASTTNKQNLQGLVEIISTLLLNPFYSAQ